MSTETLARLVRTTIALLTLVLTGCGSTSGGVSAAVGTAPDPSTVSPAPAATTTGTASGSAPAFRSVRSFQPVALPVRIRIPAQKVDSRLQRVGLAGDGTIAPPRGWQQAAWYEDGPRPGQQGRAVIVGHVDSRSGPAVFFKLVDLRVGALIHVDRADGTTATFRVTGSDQFSKKGFPARLVYSPTLRSSLVLITCGGIFDHSTGHYRDNVVVTAVAA